MIYINILFFCVICFMRHNNLSESFVSVHYIHVGSAPSVRRAPLWLLASSAPFTNIQTYLLTYLLTYILNISKKLNIINLSTSPIKCYRTTLGSVKSDVFQQYSTVISIKQKTLKNSEHSHNIHDLKTVKMSHTSLNDSQCLKVQLDRCMEPVLLH